MRYIGNKTRLLPFIRDRMRKLLLPAGAVHDAFAGTAAVGRELKGLGWRVVSSDLMTYSYVFQRAYVVASRVPSFARVIAAVPELTRAARSQTARGPVRALEMVSRYLSQGLEPERGFISEEFSESANRMYFTDENAGRIDAVRRTLHEWREAQLIEESGYYLLLAGLIEAADRVANTAGVYAAYIKKWQPNALRPLSIEPVLPIAGPRGSQAHRADAVEVARRARGVDLLYLDPPYNARQYAGYYHVPEIIARGWFGEQLVLRGKTGLLEDQTLQSAWCSPSRVTGALAELLRVTSARHVLVSYNSEGLLPSNELVSTLRDASTDGRVRIFRKRYKRYRADRDRVGRQYSGDWVEERLYYAKLPGREGERG